MTRQTSIEVYHEIEASGLLSKRRFEVYEAIFRHGPLTAGETWYFHLQDLGCQINSISPRMAELKERGVIQEVGQRTCKFSGKMALVWDVTKHLPIEPHSDIKKSKAKFIKELQEELVQREEEISFLKKQLQE